MRDFAAALVKGRSVAVAVPIAVATALAPALTLAARVECRTDADCGADLQCVENVCEEPFECVAHTECGAGMQCVDGVCEEAVQCTRDADCGPTLICEQFLCIPARCSSAKPCDGDKACIAGRCKAPSPKAAVEPAGTQSSQPETAQPWAAACGASTTVREARQIVLEPLRFDFDSVTTTSAWQPSLERTARCLTALVKTRAISKVELQGHTDTRGVAIYNFDLSRRRAQGVRKILVKRYPELRGILKATWFGETKPLCTEQTTQCENRNRRVAIAIH